MSRTIQLSFSGLSASVAPDGFSETGQILEIGGAEQSHVDLAHPDYIFYEYLRRIANLADLLAPAGEAVRAAHLGAGALTLVRYLQATRPGSAQLAVDIERELPGFVMEQLPLPAGTNCKVLIEDAAAAAPRLKEELAAPGGLDLVVLDIFSGWEAPPHLTTADFYTDLRDALAPASASSLGGLLAVNVGDDAGLTFFSAQARTLLEVFNHVWCLAEAGMLTGRSAGNLILVGSERALEPETAAALLAAGPHPAAVLGTDELLELLKKLA
ncbi:MAG: fused MFS/spermidine synthase [Rothia sp. (in: high G+C Gram-positive bacteria)]|nr:fused MFS/spermidine synthase [Rothia sp. (in: high G+C Gram-positive bacteria)]